MGSKNGKPVLREEDIQALSRSSGKDPAVVQDQFNSFVKEHPNGKMKKKDFRELMSEALPKKEIAKMEDHVFRVYDANNDGYIDFVEFMVVYYVMSDGSADEVLTKIFRVFDVNSDGTISKKELQRLVKDMYGLINKDNPEKATRDMIAKSAFAEMDKDADGKISTDEFITACLSQEQFTKLLALKAIDIFIETTDDN